ncbi:NAD(P)-dependent oxidoreductase [Paenibacillus polymyxa]|uniref:NAD(P)-dependent oxidoreductase n=1 Tax=Paenibacillus polymyxa TaxID=1406 RepID=UPI002AB4AC05|nr:NAD(P)-dependent oxidoreductase [Paenibacillus polymyxa]MDY8116741.1 NAD(P)-dependent oxidoreductase [Paenibacillus polymyxa]
MHITTTHLLNIEQANGINMEGHLLVLDALVKETNNPDNTRSVILQHILPTTVEYIEKVNSIYPVELIIAITYSADQETVELLRSRGYEVVIPKDIDDMLNNTWKLVVEKLESSDKPLIIQEVGGYFADWTEKLGEYPHFKGCVEDTNNGLWRYQAAANNKPLSVPVISMADTPLKHVEDALIGDACVYSLEKVMRSQMSSIIAGLRCGVVGWGHIGKSVAAAFVGRHADVSIYDINPIVDMLAYAQGYSPVPLAKLLNVSDIIMGCSGRRSIRVADLNDLKNGIILCSASSKNIEFDLEGFAQLCDIEDITIGDIGKCAIQKYTVRKTQKFFYVLKQGTPINFLDKPLQGAILDCTCSELFVCMQELASKSHNPGIISLTENLQVTVAKKWLKTYPDVFKTKDAEKDKVYFYPESWYWE